MVCTNRKLDKRALNDYTWTRQTLLPHCRALTLRGHWRHLSDGFLWGSTRFVYSSSFSRLFLMPPTAYWELDSLRWKQPHTGRVMLDLPSARSSVTPRYLSGDRSLTETLCQKFPYWNDSLAVSTLRYTAEQ